MDIAVVILIVAVIAVAFYVALRVYSRRQVARGEKPVDTD